MLQKGYTAFPAHVLHSWSVQDIAQTQTTHSTDAQQNVNLMQSTNIYLTLCRVSRVGTGNTALNKTDKNSDLYGNQQPKLVFRTKISYKRHPEENF